MAKSEITKRIKKLSKELATVNSGLDAVTRKETKTRSVRSVVDALDGLKKRAVSAGPILNASRQDATHHGNLPGYLSSGFQPPSRLLRRERRIQRNKAIAMIIFVLLVLFLIARRFLF